ncbi:reverse transcriptase/maturase family protein [Gudongella oleilytica]|uniref:reverse transcriptase/maturase family protein n=1 Tax=Gudongella oleilytica TaxID=1582259 RepID=UPI002A364C3A|nr:reverse transcriptase/maturase family protein [Gudongella oleilytica]MDY0256264.1 reverse transcriptase/maturase family protein [Gudongella oleilytica]
MNGEQTSPSDFVKLTDLNNLYAAYMDARKGKRWKYAVVRYEVNALENLTFLHYMLTSKKYRLSPYNCFMVHEPKERLIMYNSFRDKIVQHSLCDNVLEPRLQKTFILDNYASQKGKGTHFGLDRLKAFMRRYYRQFGADGWVLKCDVRKYFYTIDHGVLKSQLRRLIHDPDVLWLLDMIIDSTEGKGIPIGNHTSQWFAVLYLSGMDHFIKERLGIKFYGRYMDDFYLIHNDKEHLKYCLLEIRKYVESLGLELNGKTAIFPLSQGIDFLGFRTFMTDTGKVVQKIRRDSKNRIRRKLKKFRNLLNEGRIDFETILASYASWKGHAEHGDSHHLIRQTDELFYCLFSKELEGYHGKANIDVTRWRNREVREHEVQQ